MTAVAQVTSFVLWATKSDLPSQSWREEAKILPTWPAEYVDVLKDISPTPEKKKDEGGDFKSKFIDAYVCTPIQTRSMKGCKDQNDAQHLEDHDDQWG